MPKVKLTITESKCRCGYFKKGQAFIVEELCPPLCHELWNNIYPSVYALQNGAALDYGGDRAKVFDAKCPDEGRVCIHGEVIDQQIPVCKVEMGMYEYITLREKPDLKETAAQWFHNKFGVPIQAYLDCMESYVEGKTEYGWYLCLDEDRIVGGMGVVENDFHDRKDLSPNICAVFTETEYRHKGIAGHLLDMVVEDLRTKGISPVYLVTDHTGFYERYGWEFLCMVQGDGEPDMTRMYIHR